LTDRKRTT